MLNHYFYQRSCDQDCRQTTDYYREFDDFTRKMGAPQPEISEFLSVLREKSLNWRDMTIEKLCKELGHDFDGFYKMIPDYMKSFTFKNKDTDLLKGMKLRDFSDNAYEMFNTLSEIYIKIKKYDEKEETKKILSILEFEVFLSLQTGQMAQGFTVNLDASGEFKKNGLYDLVGENDKRSYLKK